MQACHLSRSWMVSLLFRAVAVFIVVFTSLPTPVFAQDSPGRFEVGGNFTAVRFGAGEFGPGIEGDLNFGRHFALDGAYSWLPTISTHVMTGLFGAKVGTRTQHFGFFGKVRPGFISIGNTLRAETIILVPTALPATTNRFGRLTERALDLGGVMEYYPARHWALRWDAGNTLLFREPGTKITIIGLPIAVDPLRIPSGITNNFQFSTGVHYRF
jgi:hypothetical protein